MKWRVTKGRLESNRLRSMPATCFALVSRKKEKKIRIRKAIQQHLIGLFEIHLVAIALVRLEMRYLCFDHQEDARCPLNEHNRVY